MGRVSYPGKRDGWPDSYRPKPGAESYAGAVGSGTYYPFGMPLSKIQEVIYRVRRFELDVSGLSMVNTTSGAYTDFPNATQKVFDVAAINMLSPSYPPYEQGYESVTVTGTNGQYLSTFMFPTMPQVPVVHPLGPTTVNNDIGIYVGWQSGWGGGGEPESRVVKKDGLWWQKFLFSIGTYEHHSFVGIPDGSVSSAILRIQIGTFQSDVPIRQDNVTTASGLVLLTAKEWWSYGGLYNESTGELV